MLLNAEELLALVNGDAEPDRLADLLDRVEHCPASAEALQVLVTLRANRAEALAALREAANRDAGATPIPHPAARRALSSMGWAPTLRLAASVAIVAVASLWAFSTFMQPVPQEPVAAVDTTVLATKTLSVIVAPENVPPDVELTGSGGEAVQRAYDLLKNAEYEATVEVLEGQAVNDRAHLYLGTAYYFLERYEDALAEFEAISGLDNVDETAVLQQAGWYEANALLALDRPFLALGALENVKSRVGYPLRRDALETYDRLRAALGVTVPTHEEDQQEELEGGQ